MKKTFLPVMGLILSAAGAIPGSNAQTYLDTSASPRQRAESIVHELSLEEKAALMMHQSPAIPRLGIKQYNWWNEALHGVARAGLATVFPQPIGLAATFNDELVYDIFCAVSDEARAKNQKAKAQGPLKIYEGLTFWTPNVNLFRDPRWGRGHETYGEDPYLTARMGVSVVRGLQGDAFGGGRYQAPRAPKYYKLHACAKHFAVHSGPEWSRHIIDINYLRPRDLWETYLPAFKALVVEGGVKEVMCAYNRFEGQPCCGNSRLLKTILREDWAYDGIVLSDCWAINDFYSEDGHGTEPDSQHAVATAVSTGTDLECGQSYANLVEAVQNGLINEETLDQALIKLMEARYQLGEMDDDSLVEWTQIPYSVIDSPQHRILARRAALESIVLLKNNGILPLPHSAKVALLGPNANDSVMQWGNYNGYPSSTSTLLSALRERLPDEQLVYVPGLDHTSENRLESLFDFSYSSDGLPGWDAVFYNDRYWEDELGMPDAKQRYYTPLKLTTAGATVWAPGVDLGGFVGVFSSTFKPRVSEDVVFSLETQGLVVLQIDGERVFRGGNLKGSNIYTLKAEAGKEYEICLIYSATEGSCASLNFDFGRPIPLDLRSIASQVKDCDLVIFAGGLSPNLEGEEMPIEIPGFRGGDRVTIELPKVQTDVLQTLHNAGKKIVYVNYSGSAVAFPKQLEWMDAVVQAWYPGQDGGNAVADVLMGDYNPSGKLPVTFYASTSDLPDIEDYNMANRTYRFFKGKPMFPFGYGLSYSKTVCGKATVAAQGSNVVVTVPVTNVSEREAQEVVQIYLLNPNDKEGPLRSLRAFKRIAIPARETKYATLQLSPSQFAWYDTEYEEMVPLDGRWVILYGTSSDLNDLQSEEIKIQF